jgi:hypothetical protein
VFFVASALLSVIRYRSNLATRPMKRTRRSRYSDSESYITEHSLAKAVPAYANTLVEHM